MQSNYIYCHEKHNLLPQGSEKVQFVIVKCTLSCTLMRPSSHLCIFLFGTRAQDYTSQMAALPAGLPKLAPSSVLTFPLQQICPLPSLVAQPHQEAKKCCHSQQPPEIIKAAMILLSRSWAHAKRSQCLRSTQPSQLPALSPHPSCPVAPLRPDTELGLCRVCWT